MGVCGGLVCIGYWACGLSKEDAIAGPDWAMLEKPSITLQGLDLPLGKLGVLRPFHVPDAKHFDQVSGGKPKSQRKMSNELRKVTSLFATITSSVCEKQ